MLHVSRHMNGESIPLVEIEVLPQRRSEKCKTTQSAKKVMSRLWQVSERKRDRKKSKKREVIFIKQGKLFPVTGWMQCTHLLPYVLPSGD